MVQREKEIPEKKIIKNMKTTLENQKENKNNIKELKGETMTKKYRKSR